MSSILTPATNQLKFQILKILSTCKGGGYRYCRTEPKHPKANSKGLYPLHRVLMENKIGRFLLPDEDVHHKDEDKTNDSIDNLEVLTKVDHAKHHTKTLDAIKCKCPECDGEFELRPNIYRLRLKRNRTGKVFCSRVCSGRYSAATILKAN